MNRREFISHLTSASIATFSASSRSQQPEPSLSFDDHAATVPVPADFLGLSYEAAQLANPDFFAPTNKQLITLFREITTSGNLRIGGGSSEFTTYSSDTSPSAPPFEIFGPDTSKTAKSGTTTSAFALQNLRGFLDATGWSCLYGLNLGQGTPQNAADEAAAAYRILGPRLLAFQIGNEPDSFRNRYRPTSYTPQDFLIEWNRFHEAILKTTPQAKFAGPDISNKLDYLTAFAAEAPKHPNVIMLTSHYYAMGPAGNPGATIDNLLDPDPKLTTLKQRDLHIIKEAQETAHLPYRMSEGNSCWNGGQAGVSDVFASALWAADYALQCACRGWAGVNFHGGGNGIYSPIVGSQTTGFSARPEFYGIQFASHVLGARMMETSLINTSPRVTAYVFEQHGILRMVLINKTPDPISCKLQAGIKAARRLTLHAPSISSTTGVELTSSDSKSAPIIVSQPYTASLFQLHSSSSKRHTP